MVPANREQNMLRPLCTLVGNRARPGAGHSNLRGELYALIEEVLTSIAMSATPFYILLTGPKGIGKSMVGRRPHVLLLGMDNRPCIHMMASAANHNSFHGSS